MSTVISVTLDGEDEANYLSYIAAKKALDEADRSLLDEEDMPCEADGTCPHCNGALSWIGLRVEHEKGCPAELQSIAYRRLERAVFDLEVPVAIALLKRHTEKLK